MASLAALNCKIIDGFGRTATLNLDANSIPNHSWNVVELNNKWYVCDATWSAGRVLIEDDGPKFESDYHDGYFLAEPALFVKNHYPLETNWTLLENPPSFIEFLDGPIVYKKAFKPIIIPTTPKNMHFETVKNQPVSFVLEVSNAIKTEIFSLLLDNGSSAKNIQPKITTNKGGLTLHYSFEKTGKYDVHIKLNEAIVATYVVKVKRK